MVCGYPMWTWAQDSDESPLGFDINTSFSTFAKRTALPGDLDRVLAALLAGHGRAVRLAVHTLAEGAVILFPLLLVRSQLIVHPAAGLSAVH